MAKIAAHADPLTPAERSERMSRVRNKGNRSTEEAVRSVLEEVGLSGWESHPPDVSGKPDFYLREVELAVFVDGCFWHGCPACDRNIPRSNTEFWMSKIKKNQRRDRRVDRMLWKDGRHVLRIWEHEIASKRWLSSLRRMLTRLGYDWRERLTEPQSR